MPLPGLRETPYFCVQLQRLSLKEPGAYLFCQSTVSARKKLGWSEFAGCDPTSSVGWAAIAIEVIDADPDARGSPL